MRKRLTAIGHAATLEASAPEGGEMPVDGDIRYDPETNSWVQYNDPPGNWEPAEAKHGPLDRPVDGMEFPGAEGPGAAQ